MESQKLEKLKVKYSSFNAWNIGQIIASIISVYEGERYVYQWALDYSVKSYTDMVVSLKDMKSFYQANTIKKLIAEERVLRLVNVYDKGVFAREIQFYSFNVEEKLVSIVDFGRFTYIQDFIDCVIYYRIENNKEDISRQELENLAKEFVSSKVLDIQENYAKIENNHRQQLEEKLQEEKEGHQKTLNGIINETHVIKIC